MSLKRVEMEFVIKSKKKIDYIMHSHTQHAAVQQR